MAQKVKITVIVPSKPDVIYSCPIGWTVAQARDAIRERYGIEHGAIESHGTELLPQAVINPDLKELEFVDGVPRSGKNKCNFVCDDIIKMLALNYWCYIRTTTGSAKHTLSHTFSEPHGPGIHLHGHSHIAQPARHFLPPPPHIDDIATETHYVLQIKFISVDPTKSNLTPDRGFRNFVRRSCAEIGVSGYVWRIPNVHAKILARGTRMQLQAVLDFAAQLREHGYVGSYIVESEHDYIVSIDGFDVLPSTRKYVETGEGSDKSLDDVHSTGSHEIAFVGSPAPKHIHMPPLDKHHHTGTQKYHPEA